MSDWYECDYDGETMNDCDDFDDDTDYENEKAAEAQNEASLGYGPDFDDMMYDECKMSGHVWHEWQGCSECLVCGVIDC